MILITSAKNIELKEKKKVAGSGLTTTSASLSSIKNGGSQFGSVRSLVFGGSAAGSNFNTSISSEIGRNTPKSLKDILSKSTLLSKTFAEESHKIKQRLSARNTQAILWLYYATTIIGIISFAVLYVSHITVGSMIHTTESGLVYMESINIRDINAGMALYRCRQLELAYLSGNTTQFSTVQQLLKREMLELQTSARHIFKYKNTKTGLTDSSFTKPTVFADLN